MRRNLLVRASAIAILASGLVGTALAQDVPTGQDAATAQASVGPVQNASADGVTGAESSDQIVVTGSRIRAPNMQGLEPTTFVTNQYIDDRALTNAADALNEIPGIRGSISPAGAQGSFGQGVNFINAFGLGSNRTLTLVNGRRYVSSNVNTIFNQGSQGTQVDVNVIPTLLVNRIDVLSVGGAPVYGSDAIAGTVNFILDSRLKGVRAQATSGITEQGDAFRYNVALAGGMDFADGRGNITLAYTRDEQRGAVFNQRDFLRANVSNANQLTAAQAAALRPAGITPANDGRVNPGIGFNENAADGIPGLVLIRNRTIPLLTRGGLITAASRGTTFTAANSVSAAVQNLQFNPAGEITPFDSGIRFLSTQEASGGDGFKFNDYSQITSDVKRDIFNAFAAFDVAPALTLFAEGAYFHSRGDELVQQPTFNSSLFGGVSSQLTFDVNNPFLTPQARQQLVGLGVNRFQLSRASIDLADVTGFSTTRLYRSVVGARGDFTLFGDRKFNYEVSGNYGRVNIRDTTQAINQQNFINAVNVTRNAAGQIVCNAAPTFQATVGAPVADANCVPLNVFGEGVQTQAMRDYIIVENLTRSSLEQIVFNANVGGSPVALFRNDVSFNLGYEYRQERGRFTPSDFEQRGLGRSVAIAPVSGKYSVNEVFGELLVPVITPQNDISFLSTLEGFGRGRYVHNTVNGGFFAWAAGGRIAPVRDITFIGNYTKSFRAPAITELFSPIGNTFTQVLDLCSPANINAGAVPAIRARNCGAFLAAFPNATPLDAAQATVPGQSGGNPGLQNEVARSFTYGVLLEPRFLPGFSLSVNYVNIDISNPIANLTVAQINNACFDNEDFNAADPANGNAFCSMIQRYAVGQGGTAVNGGDRGGQVVSDPLAPGVRSGFANGNRVLFNGIQAQMGYIRPLSGLGIPGRGGVDGTFFYSRRRINDITGVAPVRVDGTIGDPTFQGQLNVRYIGESFGLSMSMNYIGEQLFSRATRGPDIREIDKLDDFVLFNPSVFLNIQENFRLTFAVTNLFNRNGQKYFGEVLPASYSGIGVSGSGPIGGDLLGRRFAVTARANF